MVEKNRYATKKRYIDITLFPDLIQPYRHKTYDTTFATTKTLWGSIVVAFSCIFANINEKISQQLETNNQIVLLCDLFSYILLYYFQQLIYMISFIF